MISLLDFWFLQILVLQLLLCRLLLFQYFLLPFLLPLSLSFSLFLFLFLFFFLFLCFLFLPPILLLFIAYIYLQTATTFTFQTQIKSLLRQPIRNLLTSPIFNPDRHLPFLFHSQANLSRPLNCKQHNILPIQSINTKYLNSK